MKSKYLYYKACYNGVPLNPGEEEEVLNSPYSEIYKQSKPKRATNFDKAANSILKNKPQNNYNVFNNKYSSSINKKFHEILEYIVDYFSLDVNNPDLERFEKVNIQEAKQEVCDKLRMKLDKEWAQIYCDKVNKLKDFDTLYRFLIYYSQF